MLRRPLPGLLLAALLLAGPSASALAPETFESAAKREITATEAQKAGMLLAGPRFLGRGTGQKGNEDAAKWLAGELIEAGFEPGPSPPSGKGGKPEPEDFLQWFELPAGKAGTGAKDRSANVVGILRGAGVNTTGTATPSAGGGDDDAARAGVPVAGEAGPGPLGEVVVLGAHFDHLGIRGGDPKDGKPAKKSGVFWGADDNGSGTTGALMVARTLGRLAKGGLRPRRTIVVAFFTGEELGLLGSKQYVAAPVAPLADTVAMINLDMIGRNATKSMEVYGNASSPELDAWHRKVLEETKLECTYPPPALLQRSDQWSFYEAKVPVLFFHGGLHKDYHTVKDVPEELNYAKVALLARHAGGVLWIAANEAKRPGFLPIDMTGVGGKLGLAVDPCTPEEEEALGLDDEKTSGVRVTNVFTGSMGEKLFQPGDLIYSWNGFPIWGDDPVGRFTAFVNAARDGDQVVIRFLRGKERKAASVKF